MHGKGGSCPGKKKMKKKKVNMSYARPKKKMAKKANMGYGRAMKKKMR